MKISQYFKSLLPSFGKDTVLEDIRVTKGEIKDTVAPAYAQGAELMKNWKFKSPQVVELSKIFGSLASTSGNIIVTVNKSIPEILKNFEEVEDLIVKSFNDDVAAQGLTYLKAQLLQYVEAASFFAKYSRQLLNYIYVHESAAYVEESDEQFDAVQAHLVPGELLYIEQNIQAFAAAFNALTTTSATLKKQLSEIPDIVITDENSQTLPHTVGLKKIDPAGFGLIPVKMNPIYHIRMAIATWQVEQYKLAEQELQLLQMRKLNLEKLVAKQPNAKLQQEIDYTESRIQGLRAKIAKVEAEYA